MPLALDYNGMCRLSMLVCGAVSSHLFFFPRAMDNRLGVESHPSAAFYARRASMLLAGIRVTLYLETTHNTARALGYGMITSMGGMAVLGTGEWWRGAVKGNSIGLPIFIEALLAIGFGYTLSSSDEKTK